MSFKVAISGDIIIPFSEKEIEKQLRTIALNTVAMLKNRIQNDGEKTDGSKIKTKAKKKTGAYSQVYGKKRQKSGYQTQIIDLTVTGDLMDRGLTAAPTGVNEWSVGFTNDIEGDKADYLEQYFGTIFHLSEEEIKIVTDL